MSEIEVQAQMILDTLVNVPFSGCTSISRSFIGLTISQPPHNARIPPRD